jgi:hypothetical protein
MFGFFNSEKNLKKRAMIYANEYLKIGLITLEGHINEDNKRLNSFLGAKSFLDSAWFERYYIENIIKEAEIHAMRYDGLFTLHLYSEFNPYAKFYLILKNKNSYYLGEIKFPRDVSKVRIHNLENSTLGNIFFTIFSVIEEANVKKFLEE